MKGSGAEGTPESAVRKVASQSERRPTAGVVLRHVSPAVPLVAICGLAVLVCVLAAATFQRYSMPETSALASSAHLLTNRVRLSDPVPVWPVQSHLVALSPGVRHAGSISHTAVSADGRRLAYADADGNFGLVDLDEGAWSTKLEGSVSALAIAPDGEYLGSSGDSNRN